MEESVGCNSLCPKDPGALFLCFKKKKTKPKPQQKAALLLVVNVAIQDALAPGFPSPSAACASSPWCQGSLLQAGGEQCDSQALTAGLFLLQCTDADGPAVDRARAWCEMTDVPYFR